MLSQHDGTDSAIHVVSLRTSASGHLVDFRYTIPESGRAEAFLAREVKPYLIDQTSGVRLSVPDAPKIGPLRQTARSQTPGRVYFALFANPGKAVKPGSKVTVVMGELRLENLSVQ